MKCSQTFSEQYESGRRFADRSRDGSDANLLLSCCKKPSDGTYVSFPIDDLLAIVALESQKQQYIVIGENLGTMPDGFRPVMTEPKATISDYAHYYTQPQSIMSRSTYM